MNKYIENQNDLLYYNDIGLAVALVKKWLDAKPDNKDLQELAKALCSISFYVNSLTLDRYSYTQLISEARNERNKAILKLREIAEENVKLKKLQEL
jgi:hypothetical protein